MSSGSRASRLLSSCHANFLARSVKSLEGCHGPHYSVREIFVKARQMAPCLLVFEDLDSLVTDKVKSFFLNEVDGLESNDGIMMIGSTNYRKLLIPGLNMPWCCPCDTLALCSIGLENND